MLDALSSLVEELGAEMLGWRGTEATSGVWEGSQLKTEADRRAHGFLQSRLLELAPDIPFVSEEDPASQSHTRPSRYWLADPIDGTASYAGGFAGFVTQVALMENNQPALAAIRAPALEQTYLASRGKGATLNGLELRLAPRTEAPVLIDNYPEPRGITARLYGDLGFDRYVECGSISLKICRIADANADVFFKDVTVRDWDIAAPHLVLQEAGGNLTLASGDTPVYDGSFQKPGLIATANRSVHQQIVRWYEKHTCKEVSA